jgi:hypothetical protein
MPNNRIKIGKYEAWVVVEDENIELYKIDINEESKVGTCWIASTTGKVRYILLSQLLYDYGLF